MADQAGLEKKDNKNNWRLEGLYTKFLSVFAIKRTLVAFCHGFQLLIVIFWPNTYYFSVAEFLDWGLPSHLTSVHSVTMVCFQGAPLGIRTVSWPLQITNFM